MDYFSPLSNVGISRIGRMNSDMQDTLRREFLLAEQGALDLGNEDQEERVYNYYSLPFFQASLFSTILEDSLTEMRILVECNSRLRLVKAAVDLTQLRALKYDVQQPVHSDELDGIDERNLGCDEHHKINKLDADRKMLQNSWISMYLDISLRRSYVGLATQVHNIMDRIDHYNFIKDEEAKNKMTRKDLAKQLRQHRNHAKTVYYDTNLVIEQLKTEVEDAAANAEIRSRYVTGWQRARTEQNDQLIRSKESLPSQRIEYYKQKCDQEHRVHTEVELLTTITINEKLQKVETWMAKYDKDMEAIDLKIQIIKNKHVVAMEKRQELEERLAKHAELVTLWLDFKDAREKARRYRQKMTDAAIAVQAWWRGLLVRNQLGPYKPQSKRRGAAMGKKK